MERVNKITGTGGGSYDRPLQQANVMYELICLNARSRQQDRCSSNDHRRLWWV